MKGLYAKARAGEIPEFTGVSDPYEPPLASRGARRDGRQDARAVRGRGRRLARAGRLQPTPALTQAGQRAAVSSARSRASSAGAGSRRARRVRRRRGTTSNAPTATRRSPLASPIDLRGHAGRDRASEHARDPVGVRPTARHATSTRRSTPRPRCTPVPSVRSTRNPTAPANAISQSATASPPSLTSCTPLTSRSPTSSATNSCSARAAVEVGGRRHPAGLAVHHRGPLRPAELRRASRRARRSSRRGAARAGGGASGEIVDQPEHADDGRRMDVGAARLVVEATRCRR